MSTGIGGPGPIVPGRPAALVTGASSGIGFALADMLAREGHDLTVVARGADRLGEAAERLRGHGVGVLAHVADLAEEEGIAGAFSAHAVAFGRLDVLVNNAGAAEIRPVADLDAATIDRLLAVNVRSIPLAYREALPLLSKAVAETGRALVWNVASIVARDGVPGLSVYSATKAAVLNFTQAMQKELGPQGIRSTALSPAFVDTPFTDAFKQRGVPAESMLRPEDVAALARPLLHLSAWAHVPELVLDRAS